MGPCSLQPKSRQTEEEINTQSANHTQLNQNVFCSPGVISPHPLLKDQQGKERKQNEELFGIQMQGAGMVPDNKFAVHLLELLILCELVFLGLINIYGPR